MAAVENGDPPVNQLGSAFTTDAMVEHYSLVGSDEKTAVSRAVAEQIGVPEVSPRDELS